MVDSGVSLRHRRKRKSKCIKASAERYRYVLGHDIFLDRVSTLCSRALVGRLEYCKMDKQAWVSWATDNWKPLFNYVPTISLLSRGWIVIVFLDPEHCTRVLDCMWRVGNGSLVLGRWHSKFDPLKEPIRKRHLWVLLPQLPFPLWSKPILEGIGNTIGRFVSVDDDFMLVYDKRVARILVEFDITRGLPAEIELLLDDHLLIQRLDYLYVPFRCSFCRSVGHLRHSCPQRVSGIEPTDTSLHSSPSSTQRSPVVCRSPSGTVLDFSPPFEIVPDALFEAVDNLILTHKKASSHPSSVVTLPDPALLTLPQPASDSSLDPFLLGPSTFGGSTDSRAMNPPLFPLALDSLRDFPPLSHNHSTPGTHHSYPSRIDPQHVGPQVLAPPTSSPSRPSSRSPTSSPSFSDPTLKRTLSVFTAATPQSPSTLPLNSIRFANVTIRKSKKKLEPHALSPVSPPYIPLSVRLLDSDSISPRGLRACAPQPDSYQ